MEEIKIGDNGTQIASAVNGNFSSLETRLANLQHALENDYYPKTEMDAIVAAIIGTIEVTSEFETHQLIQRGASFTIAGTINNGLTGDIEASFNGSVFTTIATIADGEFSGTYSIANGGVGTLTVRLKSKPMVKQEFENFIVGKLFLICGDSNSVGRGINPQVHGLSSLKPVCFREDGYWVEANDKVDVDTNVGSHWPLLARLLTLDDSIPVGFVTTGTGSKDIIGAGSVAYYEKGKHGYDNILVPQAIAAGGRFESLLLHLGPNAALSVSDSTTYANAVKQFIDDLHVDVQEDLQAYIALFGRCTSTPFLNNVAVRKGVLDAINTHAFIEAGPNLMGFTHQDNVHPRTDIELAITAGRWFAALKGKKAPSILSARYKDNVITVKVDSPLSEPATAYSTAMWRLTIDGVSSTPTSVTKTGPSEISLTFSSPIVGTVMTLRFITDESHATATIPTGLPTELPTEIHGVNSVVQPLQPCDQFPVTPRLPNTVVFNGTTSYVEGSPSAVFQANAPFTVAVTVSGVGAYLTPQDCIFSRGGSSRPFQAFFDGLVMNFGNTSGWKSFTYPVDTGPNGRWTFIYDPSRETFERFRAFLNGAELSGSNVAAFDVWSSGGVMRFGLRVSSNSFPLNGKLTNPKVWNRLCLPSDTDQSSGLILNLNEIDGSSWIDESPSASHFSLLAGAVADLVT